MIENSLMRIAALHLVAAFLLSCDGTGTGIDGGVPVAALEVIPGTATVEIGRTVKVEKTRHSGGYRALMDFDAWKTFWSKHGLTNDKNSRIVPGNTVSYDRSSQKLKLHIAFDPAKMGSKTHKMAKHDFFGRRIPADGKAAPGPFQNLKKGDNVFKIWSGIPIPEKGPGGGA